MAYTWSSNLETGNSQIDTEHKQLIDAVNNLLEACKAGKGRAELEKTMDFLSNYTVTHFAHEENLQQKSNYPGYIGHKKLHSDFVAVVAGLSEQLKSEGATLALMSELNMKIGDWLINHIKGEDVKVAQHIKTNS